MSSTIQPLSRWPTNCRIIIPKKFSHCCKSYRTHNRFPNLEIQQKNWVSQGNLTLKVNRIWLQNFHRTQKQTLAGHNKTLCTPGLRRKKQWPTKDWATLAWECPGVSGGGVSQKWPAVGSGAQTAAFLGAMTYWHRSFLKEVDITPTVVWPQAKLQPHLLAEVWIKDLLSLALLTRATPSFPHNQSLPSGSFHKPLILIHQRADRMKTTITEN